MIHIRISLVFILLLDIEMLTIVPNFNIYEDICHAQPSSEHFSSYPALARARFYEGHPIKNETFSKAEWIYMQDLWNLVQK